MKNQGVRVREKKKKNGTKKERQGPQAELFSCVRL